MSARAVNVRLEPYDVYMGRAGRGLDGYFGNPHHVGPCRVCTRKHAQLVKHARGEAVAEFRHDFATRIVEDAEYRRRVLECAGLRCGCFCKPAACHVDVIVNWLNSPARVFVGHPVSAGRPVFA